MNNPSTSAAKQPSPTRPAALDGLLAHIARRIEQTEASTLAGHDSPAARDGAATGTQTAVDGRPGPDAPDPELLNA